MAIIRRPMRTRQLHTGMVVDQTIMDKAGRALIERGAALDDFQIEGLMRLGIMEIYIREGEEDPAQEEAIPQPIVQTINRLRGEDKSKVTLRESVKARISQGVQFLYNNPADPGFLEATNNIAEELLSAISENDAIAVDISALKVSDEYTFKHSIDVSTIAMIIAKKHGMTPEAIREIGIAGLLHDMGKSKIPPEILNKPAQLTPEEFEIMKQHSVLGYRILQEKKQFSQGILMGVLQHHEKLSGKGYPLGVTEGKIHPYAKIIAMADIYDALVTERSYKKGFSPREAVEMIMAMTADLDIHVMRSFLNSVILYPVDSIVTLSNGERAKVVCNDPDYILRPTVVGLKSGKVYNLSTDLKCASILIL